MSTPSEQTILVTGANGYVAQHIVREALERGYHVRGTARSGSSLSKLRTIFAKYSSQLSLMTVPDITNPDNYEAAFANAPKPITAVMSVAAPFVLKVEDNKRDLLDPAISGAQSILEATRRYGKDVQRVVNTSSFASINNLSLGARPGYTYTSEDWNDMSYDDAANADGVIAYCTSKALAEKAMWSWMESEKPHFSLSCICPPWVFGPHVAPIADIKHLNESSGLIWALYEAEEIPAFDFGGFADVRDVADAHLAAFERQEAAGKRFLVGSKFSYQAAVDTIREQMPDLNSKLPIGTPGKAVDAYHLDGSKAEEVLGITYTLLSKTMKDTFVQLLEAADTA